MCFMKNSLRILLLFTLWRLCVINCNAQSLEGDHYNPNTVSAQVSDMFRYGEFGVSLFTGRMQQTIPIYTLDDPDFKMNIALHYNAEGFKPRKHSGYVGYNWFLEAGGCITREVNGRADEIYGHEVLKDKVGVQGMYNFLDENPYIDKNVIYELPNASDEQACKHSGEMAHNPGNKCDRVVDYLPDVFYFNFLGYSGSFMINNKGKVQILSGDYVDVDLSGILTDWEPIALSRVPTYPYHKSRITIKTTDGYTYIFGGDLSKLEYTVSTYRTHFLPRPPKDTRTDNQAIVNTWHLAKIIAPNGRIATFDYKTGTDTISPLWEFNERFDRLGRYYNDMYWTYKEMYDKASIDKVHLIHKHTQEEWDCLLTFYCPDYYYPTGTYYMYSTTKTCILESIDISGDSPLTIKFDNSLETTAMYDEREYEEQSRRNYQLNAVRILSSDRTIKTAKLSYIDHGYRGAKTFNWRFLKSVQISGVGAYQMEYNNYSFPNLRDLVANNYNAYDYKTCESAEADDYGYGVTTKYNLALLKKMSFPTGGYQTYEYEPYAYDKKRKYKVVNEADIEMQTAQENGVKKGVRIKEVKTYNVDENHPIETKSYVYENGVFYDNLKIYNLAEDLNPTYGWAISCKASYGSLDTHIGYGKVTESTTTADGTTNTTIYNFDMGEDSYSSQGDDNFNERFYCQNRKFVLLTGHLLYSNKLHKWGKLLSVENRNSNGKLVKTTTYEYNDMPKSASPSVVCSDTIVIFDSGYGAEISKKLFVCPNYMTKKVTRDYPQGGGVSTTIVNTYSYDNKLRVKEETIKDSRAITHFTRYTYPDKMYGNTHYSSFDTLSQKGIIGHPVETITGYIQGGTEYVTGGKVNIWAFNIVTENGKKVKRPYLSKTFSLALTEPLYWSKYKRLSAGQNKKPIYDSHYVLDAEYKFDDMNRLTSIKPYGTMETKYTWNGIYPATKTIGNQTWKYSFIPHVGVKEITDPRGITTYYTYDEAGRLVEEYQIIDGKKQILNAYQYHIKTE